FSTSVRQALLLIATHESRMKFGGPSGVAQKPAAAQARPSSHSPSIKSVITGRGLSPLVKRIFSLPAVLCSFILLKVFVYCLSAVGDNDIFWHLRNARFMVAQHRFPRVDAYSFTAAGTPWLSHEWLSELFYYGAFRVWNWRGLFLLTFL